MSNNEVHEKVVKNASKIADSASHMGINAAARKHNISPWCVYVAKAIEGEYVPSGTMALIKERVPSLRKTKRR